MKQSSSSWAPRLRRLAVVVGTVLLFLGGVVVCLGAVAALRAVLGSVSDPSATPPALAALLLLPAGVLTSAVGFVLLFLVARSVEPDVEYVNVSIGSGPHSVETLSEYRTRLADALEVDRSSVIASRIGYGGGWFLRTSVPWPDDERLPDVERRVLDAVGSSPLS